MWSRTGAVALLAFTPLFIFAAQQGRGQSNCTELVFSGVRHIAESDDYVGTELVLGLCAGSKTVTAIWNEYEGYHPAITELKGVRAGDAVRLAGANSEGKVEFTGKLAGKRLKGTLVWYIGRSRQSKKVDLAEAKQPVRPPQ
jgi:hypothetical protein